MLGQEISSKIFLQKNCNEIQKTSNSSDYLFFKEIKVATDVPADFTEAVFKITIDNKKIFML